MPGQISQTDIKVLIQLTLLTPTHHKYRVIVPYYKKFCPHALLISQQPIFLPLYHALKIQSDTEYAEVELQQLFAFISDQHFLKVQTYSKQRGVKGSLLAFSITFAQIVVYEQNPNHMQVTFKQVVFKASNSKLQNIRPHIRMLVSHGSSWSGTPKQGDGVVQFNETATLIYHSLLDTVIFQIWNDKTKLSESRKFIFELISSGTHIFQMDGTFAAQTLIKLRAQLPTPILYFKTL